MPLQCPYWNKPPRSLKITGWDNVTDWFQCPPQPRRCGPTLFKAWGTLCSQLLDAGAWENAQSSGVWADLWAAHREEVLENKPNSQQHSVTRVTIYRVSIRGGVSGWISIVAPWLGHSDPAGPEEGRYTYPPHGASQRIAAVTNSGMQSPEQQVGAATFLYGFCFLLRKFPFLTRWPRNTWRKGGLNSKNA